MHFKKIASTISLSFLITLGSLSCVSADSTFNAKVAGDSLIVRSGPAKEYRQVDHVSRGTVVTIYEQKSGWDRIGTNQWVAGQYLKTTTASATSIPTIKKVSTSATFNAAATNVLNVRTGPGTNYRKVSQIVTGKVVKVLEQSSGWSRIASNQWVMSQYLKKTTVKTVAMVAGKKITAPEKVVAASTELASIDPTPSEPASPTSLTTSCLAAIRKANSYCLSVGRGCTSYSKTAKCVAANESCEVRQRAALSTCPQK